jgi:hypothetical protein
LPVEIGPAAEVEPVLPAFQRELEVAGVAVQLPFGFDLPALGVEFANDLGKESRAKLEDFLAFGVGGLEAESEKPDGGIGFGTPIAEYELSCGGSVDAAPGVRGQNLEAAVKERQRALQNRAALIVAAVHRFQR